MVSQHARRRILRAGGVALVGALAGCASPGGDGEDGEGESGGEENGGEEDSDGEEEDGGGGAY